MIALGNHDVISREVLLLTHDYSIFRALNAIGCESEGKRIVDGITVGDNVFIGARTTLLPGTSIGNNVIVGACSVVKGTIPDNVVIAGNPARVIKSTEDYANAWLEANIKGK